MVRTWRVKAEGDLPPQEPGLQISWAPRLGEPAGLRSDWCALLARKYDQPVGGMGREPSRPFAEVLAETSRLNLGLWVTVPEPASASAAEFKMQTSGEEDDSVGAVDAIRREHSLGAGAERFAFGSVPVFAVGGEHVVKLYPPAQRSYFDTERAALTHIDGRLPIPTPRVIGAGECDQWLYVVMTRLGGRSMAEAWPAIEVGDRVRLVREAGVALAALHATTPEGLAPPGGDWARFLEAQRASCRDRQVARGLATPWADAIDDFLARWGPVDDGARVLLHTEVMREHFLLDRREGAWRISGLIDFEDAMLGAPEYEFAGAGLFLTCAEPGLFGALLGAYGVEPDDEIPMRIMAYALLQKYSSLRWYLERLPVPGKAGDLEALARGWFTPSA